MFPPRFFRIVFLAALFSFSCAADDNNGGFDHRAHAVPGGPYEARAGDDGEAVVKLNGDLSHSHYFNAKTGATGKVTNFVWTVGEKKICGKMICDVKFPLGKTAVKLSIVDNTGDSATASTFVHIYKGTKPGVRFLYYPGIGWIPNKRPPGVKASYSTTQALVNLARKTQFPSFVVPQKFCIRLLGRIEFFKPGIYRFRVGCGGASCTLLVGNRMILIGSNKDIDSKPIMFSKAVRNLVAVFRHQNPEGPKPGFTLSWQVPGSPSWSLVPAKFLSHSPSSYTPVVHQVSPKKADVGSIITVTGSSLLNVKSVKLESQFCAGPVSKSQFVVTCVVPGGSGVKKLSVVTTSGTSNAVDFEIVGGSSSTKGGSEGGKGPVGYYQPISFSKNFLRKNGSIWEASQLTSIALGPDGKYYIGSLNGIVHVLTTDFGNGVTNYCKSPNVGYMRSILGVAFNPAETGFLRLYASTSVLKWGGKKLLPFSKGWHNGEIIAMQNTKLACIARVATVISGLPVSNYDHGVNGISFDHNGNLLVTVGGSANAGVSEEGGPLGGVPDSPLSGAMLQAPILSKPFDGKIVYNQYENPGTARKVKGDVWVYGAGVRNSLCSVAHSNGHIYATDNGANSEFGPRSTGCKSQGDASTEPDTLKMVRKGGFHGYANRNRGRSDPKQCIHRPPQNNMKGYDKHIATFEASTNGLIEYTANTFGAQMRGDLLATKFAVSGSGNVFRVRLNAKGTVKSLYELAAFSGLAAAMSPTGGLVMPRVYQGKVAVLLPNEENPSRLVVTSVNPFRGPKRGGHQITVTGWKLNPPLTATVGGQPCTNVGNFKKSRSFTCIVPAGSGRAAVVVTRFGKTSQSYGYEYMYLNV